MYVPVRIFFNGLSPALDAYMTTVRTQMTPTQAQTLMEKFQSNPYLSRKEVCHLALSLNITKKRIENWFNYRRHRKVGEGLLDQSE